MLERFRSTLLSDLFQWLRGGGKREVLGWLAYARYLGLLLPLGVVAFVALVWYVDPLPPKRAYLGTGQPGTSQHAISERFRQVFERHGVELVLVETGGVHHNLRSLREAASPVNASFATAGSVLSGQYPSLVSLGSVQFAPMWLFYRGAAFPGDNPVPDTMTRKIAIGAEGTSTRQLLERLARISGEPLEKRENFYEYPHAEAADKLVKGELDGMFIVDGIDSPIVQKLLGTPGIQMFDFNLVDAYSKRLPFLDKVVVPRSSIDIKRDYPAKDIDLLASSVTLVVEKDVHPTIQWLFLIAAREIGGQRGTFFSKPGEFPAYMDPSVPLSPVAKRFYQGSLPALYDYLPLWLSVIVDRVWVIVLAVFGLVMPIINKFFNLRVAPSVKHLEDGFQDLREIDEAAAVATSPAEMEALLRELTELDARLRETWFDGGDVRKYYGFIGNSGTVRRRIEDRLKTLAAAPGAGAA